MKVLKVKTKQVFACYRKPMSYNYWDTFPLPPFSTVKGWFHAAAGATEYIPLSIGISGKTGPVIQDLQRLIKFQRKGRGICELEDFHCSFDHSPTYISTLYDAELTLYFLTDEQWLESFKEKVFTGMYPSLGRYEDLLRIDSLDYITLEKKSFSARKYYQLDYEIYLKKETADAAGLMGIHYRLPFKYDVIENIRYFNTIDCVYLTNGTISNGEFLIDTTAGKERIVELIGDYV
ncbi:MAG: type I-B CRISPR-associated protein Cas5 [Spirochaetales bacterium]|nr:type I-B CRISPR-associated protein Cas5 [Spirochaetales bacterium]